jgi:outer membrane protein assembly factor BamD
MRALAGLAAALLLLACAPKKPADFKTDAASFEYGKKLYAAKDYAAAREFFEDIQHNYPNSIFLSEATFLAAECHLEEGENIEAAAAYENFLRLYPTHRLAPRARFQLARAHEAQIPGTVDRDQTHTVQALEVYQNYLQQYPEGEDAARAKEKVVSLREQLARREFYVARYYLRQKKYDAALGRLLYLKEHYADIPLKGEPQYYLGLVYYRKKEAVEARRELRAFLKDYSGSPRRGQAEKMLGRLGGGEGES